MIKIDSLMAYYKFCSTCAHKEDFKARSGWTNTWVRCTLDKTRIVTITDGVARYKYSAGGETLVVPDKCPYILEMALFNEEEKP